MEFVVVESAELDANARRTLRDLWAESFGERFDDHDAEHAYGGVHVIAYDGSTLPTYQGTGVGTRDMGLLHIEMEPRWPVAMLSTGCATAFYERLG